MITHKCDEQEAGWDICKYESTWIIDVNGEFWISINYCPYCGEELK